MLFVITQARAGGTIAVKSGKWYAEVVCDAKTATNAMIGVCTVDGFDGDRQLDESQNGGSGTGYVMNGNGFLVEHLTEQLGY